MVFKLYCELRGSHVHVRVFAGEDVDHLAFAGDLTLREGEYDALWSILEAGSRETGETVLLKWRTREG